MVRRVLNLVYKEVRGLHQAAYVLALFAFGSQLLALVRDRLLAHQFGAGIELDIYYAAFRIPDLLFVLFASTLSVYVLIPFVARAKNTGKQSGSEVLSQVFTMFLLAYSLLAGVAFVFAPTLSTWLFPELSTDSELVTLMRVLLLQPLFLGISSLFGVVTQLGHRFVLYALSPLIYNLGIIFGIVVLEPVFGLSGLAYGVVLGAIGHMTIQLPLVMNSPLRFSITRQLSWQTLKGIFAVSVPRAITLSLNQLVLLVLVSIASTLAVGSVSVFQFAYNLQSVPLAVIGVSYSVAAFPILAELFAANKIDSFRVHITTALRHVIFWALPVIALIVVLRAQVVRVVLGSGEFDWSDTRLTAAILALLAVSLVFQAINLLIVRAFYAGGYTRTPLLASLAGAVVTVLAAYSLIALLSPLSSQFMQFVDLMRVDSVVGAEVLILAISYSLGVTLQTALLLWFVTKTYTLDLAWLPAHTAKSLAAALVAGVVAYSTLQFVVGGINDSTLIGIFIQGLFGGLAGISGAVVTYKVLRSQELTEVIQAFQKRLFKTDVLAPVKDII